MFSIYKLFIEKGEDILRKILCAISVTFFLLVFCSCEYSRETNVTEIEGIQIPFLLYENDTNLKLLKSKLAYWSLVDGKIDLEDDLYSVSFSENSPSDFVKPIAWDGTNFVLHKSVKVNGIDKKNYEIAKSFTMCNTWGRNIKMETILDKSGQIKEHMMSLKTKDGIIKNKALYLYKKTKDEFGNEFIIGEDSSCVDFDQETGDIINLCMDRISGSNLYVARSNIKNTEDINWTKISFPKKVTSRGNYSPDFTNSILVGNKYYIQTDNGLAEVDIERNKFRLLTEVENECKNIVKEGSFDTGYQEGIRPVGVFKDILILSVPVCSDTSLEFLMCAYKNNKFVGGVHLKRDQKWDIINHKKEIVSTIDFSKKDLEPQLGEYLTFPYGCGSF